MDKLMDLSYPGSLMKIKARTRQNIKITDLLDELKIFEGEFRDALQKGKIRLVEGQKNLDQQEAATVRRIIKEHRRREALKKEVVDIPPIIKVSELASRLSLPVGEVLGTLLKSGVVANLNDDIDYDTAAIIAADLGYSTKESVEELEKDRLTPERLEEILKKEKDSEQKERPPVVTIMGHVDHGKTTLLDHIRKSSVAKREAGGITQAVSSYQADCKGRTITFVDTPGHETFEFMRKRGVSLADIAILVVAADDGVMPQTKEAVKYAKEAGVPIIVAINKVDKPTANIDKTKAGLAEIDLNPEEWGGKTVVVPISALKGKGVDGLMEMVLLAADIDPPKAIYDRLALGSVVESRLDNNLGSLATVLIHTGTMRVGDDVVIGDVTGRVRQLLDFSNKRITKATPSMPVTIIGLNDVPETGDVLQVVENKGEAALKARDSKAPIKKLASSDPDDERKTLALVIKGDSRGSVEAIEQTIGAMVPEEVRLSMIRIEAGSVSDSDVLTAQAAGAIIYAFNVNVGGMSKKLAEKEQVQIKSFDVIYRLAEDVRSEIEKRLPVDIVRTDQGRLKVLKVFFSIKKRKIVGVEVAEGKVEKGSRVTFLRGQGGQKVPVGRGVVQEIQREKQIIEAAQQGDQVGITIEGKGKIKGGDLLEVYKEEEIKKGMK